MDWPKCEYCDGKGGQIVQAPAIPGTPDEDWFITCAFCGGTGERDLTADEAAEYLLEFYGEWESELCFYPGNEFPYELDIDCDICGIKGKTLTQALNAAARAVRDRRQG